MQAASVLGINSRGRGVRQPLLRDDLAFCADRLACNACPRPFDDLGASSQKAGARARQCMVAELIDDLPAAWGGAATTGAQW